jgi:hypothetical protein
MKREPVLGWQDKSWVEAWKPQKIAAKTTPDGDDSSEAKGRTIGGADRARNAPQKAWDDDAWHDFVDFANKFVCLGLYLRPEFF